MKAIGVQSGWPWLVGLGLVAAVPLMVLLFEAREGRPVGFPTPPKAPTPLTPVVSKAPDGPWISDKEFDSLLAGLKPTSFAEPKKVADRLAGTAPTPKQERQYADLKTKEALAKAKSGPSKRDLDAMREDDAITRVSQAAGWLMWAPDPTAKSAGVKLAMLWGTPANEANLRKIAADKKQPEAVRRDAEAALRAIEARGKQ